MAWVWVVAAVLMLAAVAGCVECGRKDETHLSPGEKRRQMVVRGNVHATHAYQLLMARKAAAEGVQLDAKAWELSGVSDEALRGLVAHQKAFLSESPEAVRDWADGKASRFDPAKDLEPIAKAGLPLAGNLPVNLLADYLEAGKVEEFKAEALASLFQMMLDIDRDGDALQDMFAMYLKLGLPVHLGQVLPVKGTEEEFAAIGGKMSAGMAVSPFATDAATLKLICMKDWNWGRRWTGERDKTVIAKELLGEPEVKAILPKLQAMKPQKIAVIGHSFTMNVNWSSPSAFAPIAGVMLQETNPKVEIKQWGAGGLAASNAQRKFFDEALAWKPDRVLLVMILANDADKAALAAMVAGFANAGAEVMMFDTLTPHPEPGLIKSCDAPAGLAKLTVVEVGALLRNSPDKDKFLSRDGIHMTEPYHRLMAKEWLAYLCGARAAGGSRS